MKVKTKIMSAAIAGVIALTAFTGIAPESFPKIVEETQVSAASESDRLYDETSGLYYKKVDNNDDGIYDEIYITHEFSDYYNYIGITSVIIPSEIEGLPVTSIGDNAFYLCTSLTDITIPNSVTYIDDNAFEYCTSLTDMIIPDSNVTSIGDQAFFWCTALTNITIPDSVTSIGDSAFRYCISLTNITIPDSVTSIGYNPFAGCTSLKKINVSENNENYSSTDGLLMNKDKTEIIYCPNGKVNVTIPDSVTSIGNWAFELCTSLTSITIPDSVTSIGKSAFARCTSLTSITIPDSVTSIGDSAFSGCTLTSIIIPDSVTSIGYIAFADCKSLTSITIPDSVTSIGDGTFRDCTSLTNITIPDSVTSIGYITFAGCKSLTSITIPDSVTSIGDGAFSGCTSLTSIIIPDSNVTSIGQGAFESCTSLTDITIPDSVTSIGFEAFARCTSLTDITILNPECKISGAQSTISNYETYEPYESYEFYFNGTIHGYTDSTAQEYAEKCGYKFEAITSDPVITTPAVTTTTTTTTTISTTTTEPDNTTSGTTTQPEESTTSDTTTTEFTTTTSTTTTAKTTEKNSSPKFVNGADNWSFKNAVVGSHYINDKYLNRLLNGLSYIEQIRVHNILDSNFGGSCYGLASTSILAAHNILDPSVYQKGANFLHDIQGPPTSEEKSLINYYYALQVTDVIQQKICHAIYDMSEKEKLDSIVECLKDGSPVLMCFHGYFHGYSWGGHAVVAYDVEYGKYSKNGKAYNGKIIVYDNNNVDYSDDYCLYFNTSNSSWCIPAYSLDTAKGSMLGLITDDLNYINYHGYLDGTENIKADDYISVLQSVAVKSDYSIRKVIHSNDNWINAATSEDDIRQFASFSDNNFENSDLMFALKDSSAGYIMNTSQAEQLDISLNYKNCLLEANADNGKSVKFSPDGIISLEGDNTRYDLNIILNDGYTVNDWNEIKVGGENVNNATLQKVNNGYVLTASNLKNVTIKAKNSSSTAQCQFSTKYGEVFVYEIDENTIGVKVDTDGNGTYETTISTSEISKLLGDINTDGKTDTDDVKQFQKFLVNKIKLTIEEILLVDMNNDGKLNVFDLLIMKKRLH